MEEDELARMYLTAEKSTLNDLQFVSTTKMGQYYELVSRFNTTEDLEEKKYWSKILIEFCRVKLNDKFRSDWWRYKLKKLEGK